MIFFLTLYRFVRSFFRAFRESDFQALTFFVFLILLSGTLFYHSTEHWRYLDSLYFSVTTLTTVGYGDLHPVTDLGKIFTIIYIFLGLGVILGFVNAIAKHARQQNPVKRLFEMDSRKEKKMSANKMQVNEEELKKKLTPEQYKILREKGTEAPFSSPLLNAHEGMFACAVCGQELFSSDAKFDSGTGWPSFDQAIPGAVEFKTDEEYGMSRTEVICSNCGSHLGHIFNDGPAETTGKRFCINGACLMQKKA